MSGKKNIPALAYKHLGRLGQTAHPSQAICLASNCRYLADTLAGVFFLCQLKITSEAAKSVNNFNSRLRLGRRQRVRVVSTPL